MSATGKKTSTNMAPLEQKRFPSGNPDLGSTTAIPRCTEFDLEKVQPETWSRTDDEFNFRVPKPGNCVRRDGRS